MSKVDKARPFARRHPALTILVCALVTMTEGFYLPASGLVGPSLMRELHLNQTQFGLTITVMMIGFLIGAALGGVIGDRSSRKGVVLAAFLGVGAATILGTLVDSYGGFLVSRFATGVGLGAGFPNIMAIAGSLVSPSLRGRAIAGANFGASFGGVCAGVLMAIAGAWITWRLVFWVAALLSVMFLPLFAVAIPRQTQIARETPAAAPPARDVLLGEGRLVATLLLWGASFFIAFNFNGIAVWSAPLFAARGLSSQVIGASSACVGLCSMTGSFCYATLLDKGRRHLAVCLGMLGAIPCILLFLFAATPVTAILAMAMIGLTVVGSQAMVFALAPAGYPPAGEATGLGACLAASRLGAIIAPTALGLALDAGLPERGLMAIMLPPAFFALICMLLLLRRLFEAPSARIAAPQLTTMRVDGVFRGR